MRGSAPLASLPSRRAACQGDVPSPVDPLDQEWALPLHGPPASEGTPSDTSSRLLAGLELRIPESRALPRNRGALLPWTPARKEDRSPLSPHPRVPPVL